MKRFTCFILKSIVAVFLATVLLSVLSLIFYNPPVTVSQPDRITNEKYKPDKYWSNMISEGIGYGKIDKFGYNNAYYPELTDPDIVFIGSSHLEAVQVPYNSNFVYLLNEKLHNDSIKTNDYKCINRGMSGHFFNVSVSNFKYIAEKYKDAKYIIIETSNVEFSPEMLDGMIAGAYHSELEDRGALYTYAQKIPYARLLLKKLSETIGKKAGGDNDKLNNKETTVETDTKIYTEKMNQILKNIADTSEKYGIKTAVVYHNRLNLTHDNKVLTEDGEKYINIFKNCCKEYNIEVIDVTQRFISNYEENYELPYGFANTLPGKGHLNKVGHELIADELYRRINEFDEWENR